MLSTVRQLAYGRAKDRGGQVGMPTSGHSIMVFDFSAEKGALTQTLIARIVTRCRGVYTCYSFRPLFLRRFSFR